MKGAMKHVGSTCCCTQEHRWDWQRAGERTAPIFSTKRQATWRNSAREYSLDFILVMKLQLQKKKQAIGKFNRSDCEARLGLGSQAALWLPLVAEGVRSPAAVWKRRWDSGTIIYYLKFLKSECSKKQIFIQLSYRYCFEKAGNMR